MEVERIDQNLAEQLGQLQEYCGDRKLIYMKTSKYIKYNQNI